MHAGDALPRVYADTPMPDIIHEMSRKGLGMTTVLEPDGRLAGIVTDGDLRRLMEKHRGATLEMTAGACMTPTRKRSAPYVFGQRGAQSDGKRKNHLSCGRGRGQGCLGRGALT